MGKLWTFFFAQAKIDLHSNEAHKLCRRFIKTKQNEKKNSILFSIIDLNRNSRIFGISLKWKWAFACSFCLSFLSLCAKPIHFFFLLAYLCRYGESVYLFKSPAFQVYKVFQTRCVCVCVHNRCGGGIASNRSFCIESNWMHAQNCVKYSKEFEEFLK